MNLHLHHPQLRVRTSLWPVLVLAVLTFTSALPVAAQTSEDAARTREDATGTREDAAGTRADAATRADFEELRRQIAELREAVARLEAGSATGDREPTEKAEATARPDESAQTDDARFAEVERQIEILARELERLAIGDAPVEPGLESEYGLGAAASKVYRREEQGLSIGGYGEVLYQSFASEREDGAPSSKTAQFDALRGVLYVGYKFSDRWLFNSELEVEHGSTDKEGSVSLELAYLDYLFQPALNFRAGLLLAPLGLVNELHEPPLFLSANRPETERVIIPSTWRENGLGVFGEAGPFSYRAYLLNGLDARGFSSSGLRGGRQKGSEAKAEDLALAARLDYTARPGLLVGVSAYLGDSGQDLRDAGGREISARTEIFDLHFDWRHRGLHLRGLWAAATIDDAARLNQALALAGDRAIAERLGGRYLEIGYDLFSRRGGEASLTPFLRAESLDTQERVPTGFQRKGSSDIEVFTLGIAFQPLDELIFKLDFQNRSDRAKTGIDQWSLGLGYLF